MGIDGRDPDYNPSVHGALDRAHGHTPIGGRHRWGFCSAPWICKPTSTMHTTCMYELEAPFQNNPSGQHVFNSIGCCLYPDEEVPRQLRDTDEILGNASLKGRLLALTNV